MRNESYIHQEEMKPYIYYPSPHEQHHQQQDINYQNPPSIPKIQVPDFKEVHIYNKIYHDRHFKISPVNLANIPEGIFLNHFRRIYNPLNFRFIQKTKINKIWSFSELAPWRPQAYMTLTWHNQHSNPHARGQELLEHIFKQEYAPVWGCTWNLKSFHER